MRLHGDAHHALVQDVRAAGHLHREMAATVVASGVVVADQAANGAERRVDHATLLGQPVETLGDHPAERGRGMAGQVLAGLLVDHPQFHEVVELAADLLDRAVHGLGEVGTAGFVQPQHRRVQRGLSLVEAQRLEGVGHGSGLVAHFLRLRWGSRACREDNSVLRLCPRVAPTRQTPGATSCNCTFAHCNVPVSNPFFT